MAPSPTQLVWRGRLESVLRLIEPGLDLMLAAGDRLSRVVEREQIDPPPPARRVPNAASRPRVAASSEPTRGGQR